MKKYPQRNHFEMAAHNIQFVPTLRAATVSDRLKQINKLANEIQELTAKPIYRSDGKLNI